MGVCRADGGYNPFSDAGQYGLFAGAALYISIVQQPASREVGTIVSAQLFPPMYRRAAPLQGGLAVLGFVAGLSLWLLGGTALWLLAAVLLGLVVPFTLLVIKPINDRLLSANLDPASPEVPDLLSRWAALHWIRTLSSLLSFLVCVAARAAA